MFTKSVKLTETTVQINPVLYMVFTWLLSSYMYPTKTQIELGVAHLFKHRLFKFCSILQKNPKPAIFYYIKVA